MKKPILYFCLFIASCGKATIEEKVSSAPPVGNTTKENSYTLSDKTERFLWRENMYDAQAADSVSTIVINEQIIPALSEPERAALGYVATFIGSDCNWDKKANSTLSNLDCKAISALGLGYQCSEQHLGFLRSWFKNDAEVLKRLEQCPKIPFTATSQQNFDSVTLSVKSDTITVWFKASGINMREQSGWSWMEDNTFVLANEQLHLIKTNKSDVKKES